MTTFETCTATLLSEITETVRDINNYCQDIKDWDGATGRNFINLKDQFRFRLFGYRKSLTQERADLAKGLGVDLWDILSPGYKASVPNNSSSRYVAGANRSDITFIQTADTSDQHLSSHQAAVKNSMMDLSQVKITIRDVTEYTTIKTLAKDFIQTAINSNNAISKSYWKKQNSGSLHERLQRHLNRLNSIPDAKVVNSLKPTIAQPARRN